MSVSRPVLDGLFTVDETGPHLLASHCSACDGRCFPRNDTCPYCATEGTEPVELSTEGQLWAWTAVTAPPPGYQGPVPYGFGVVELPEGIRVLALLTVADPAALHLGQGMRLVTTPVAHTDGTEIVSYAFEPVT